MKRAAQTAQHLSEKTGVEIAFDSDLMEFNNGLLAGLSRDDAVRRYPEVKNFPLTRLFMVRSQKRHFAAEL